MSYSVSDLPPRIARRIVIDPVTGCWLWQGARNGANKRGRRGGYGMIKWERKMQGVHRVVYKLLAGPFSGELDHVKERGCRYLHCCWPEHLEPVTSKVNKLRGDSPWAQNSRKTHCKRGHEFTPENTCIVPGNGTRQCRACMLIRQRRQTGYQGNGPHGKRDKCKRGHEMSGVNLYITPGGRRQCRACNRIRAQRAQKTA